jgi:hypothetical protein
MQPTEASVEAAMASLEEAFNDFLQTITVRGI